MAEETLWNVSSEGKSIGRLTAHGLRTLAGGHNVYHVMVEGPGFDGLVMHAAYIIDKLEAYLSKYRVQCEIDNQIRSLVDRMKQANRTNSLSSQHALLYPALCVALG